KQHWLELLPKIAVTYRIPAMENSNVYVNVSKGYKAGGYNTQMFSTILQDKLMAAMMNSAKALMPPNVAQMMPSLDSGLTVDEIAAYKPEYSWNYEIGGHFSCYDGRILTDLAAFYIDIRDQQLTVFPDGSITGRMMTNAGRTRSAGVEAAITARPTDRWVARVSYGYTNAKFLRYDDGGVSYKGKTVPYAPAHTAFASVQYSQPLPMWWFDRLDLEVNCRGVGPMYWNEENTLRQNFYELLGASVRLNLQKVSLDLWAENILNKRFNTFYFKSIKNDFVQRGTRRTFGLTLRYVM
ncbi:MAG: TonB-dependent receptor, partial [Muribaculaceae bacterium]|nr:TonB-dependent receptor [Muribaculaceae bacterium]